MRVLGSDLNSALTLPEELKVAGFDGIRHITHKCPIGVWPLERRLRLCGLFMRTILMDSLRASRRPLLALGWTQLQIEMFMVDVRKAITDEKMHAYLTYHVVYGRKPTG